MFIMCLLFCIVLSMALLMVYFLTNFSTTNSKSKWPPFECGFDPLSKMRSPFSTRFFLLVVLFLIYDVEVALLFPVLSMANLTTSSALVTGVLVFLLILIIGMFHEWNEGALDWVSK
uniref:NADH-ubiquinone oxidoreductase chain 3 n=1 Tax=Siphonaria pectinata TaxID=57642 RepID=B3DFE3_9GAST|nr:NADH dehydrogenase subunit 3 [Siphonaria pectinata]ACE62830.1 NADH dehydrogenase subunit 3 [Siphonaria pectinata]